MRRQRTMRAKVGAARECGAATALPLDTQGLATCARMPNVHAMPRTADIIDDRCCARHDGAGWRSSPNSWQHDQDAPAFYCASGMIVTVKRSQQCTPILT